MLLPFLTIVTIDGITPIASKVAAILVSVTIEIEIEIGMHILSIRWGFKRLIHNYNAL